MSLLHTCFGMGKTKRRTLSGKNETLYMTRESAIKRVRDLSRQKIFEKNSIEDIITLFGLSAEELSEGGVSYEHLKGLKHICF